MPILRLDFPGFCIEAQSLGSQNFPLSSDRFYYTVQDFLDIINQYPGLNSSKIAELIGKSVPTAKRYLNSLVKLDLIEFKGAQKTGGYYSKINNREQKI